MPHITGKEVFERRRLWRGTNDPECFVNPGHKEKSVRTK